MSHPDFRAADHTRLQIFHSLSAWFQVDRLQMENRRNASSRAAVEDLLTQKLDLAKSERLVDCDCVQGTQQTSSLLTASSSEFT